jgi:hypothetical protein
VRNLHQTMRHAAQQQSGEGAEAARSRYYQIGSLLFCYLCDHMRRASQPHPRRLESHIETFPLQVLDMFSDRGLNLDLTEVDRIYSAPADPELVYVHDDEPGAVSLCEARRGVLAQLRSNRQSPR